MKNSLKNMDMTTGNPRSRIFLFSLPIIFSNLLQQLYALTDSVIVGRYIGLDALAAIGGTSWARWAMIGICADCAMGFGIAASQRIGAQKIEELKQVIALGIKFVLKAGIILPIILFGITDYIFALLQIPSNIYEDARLYFLYAILAIPINMAYNMACAFLRAAGNSRGPFVSVIISTVINLILDILFVAKYRWGIWGAAIATITAQCTAAMIVLIMTVRKEPFTTRREHWKRNPMLKKETTKLWRPLLFNSIAIALGGAIVESCINASGSLIAAGVSAAIKIYSLLETIEKAVCSGVSVYVGQNLGAGRITRIRKGMKSMTIFSFVFSLCLTGGVLLMGDILLGLFMGDAQDANAFTIAYEAAWTCLHVQCIAVFFMVPMHIYRGALQALGHPEFALAAAVVQVFARIFTVVVLPKYFGLAGLCMDGGIAALACFPVILVPYIVFMRKLECGNVEV